MSVAIFPARRPGRLRNHNLLAILTGNLSQNGFQIGSRSVPERIVRACEHVVIDFILVQVCSPSLVVSAFFGIREVQRHKTIRVKCSYRPASRVENLRHILSGIFPADCIVRLVADLYHPNIDTSSPKRIQAIQCIRFNRIFLFCQAERFPCLGCLLLRRIRPEIRVVEVDQDFHAGIRRQLTHDLCFL